MPRRGRSLHLKADKDISERGNLLNKLFFMVLWAWFNQICNKAFITTVVSNHGALDLLEKSIVCLFVCLL